MEKRISIIDKLASSLNRRDEIPNQELAKEILQTEDKSAIKELVENLNKKKAIQNDCIKVLYEIGEQNPKLITMYIDEFATYLNSNNNRLQWGAMTALYTISNEKPKDIYMKLPVILDAADKGSVITRDHAVNILIKLCAVEQYATETFQLLIKQLLKSPTNQFPMYVERSLPIINEQNKDEFVNTLTSRLPQIDKESKRRRIEKVIRKLSKK